MMAPERFSAGANQIVLPGDDKIARIVFVPEIFINGRWYAGMHGDVFLDILRQAVSDQDVLIGLVVEHLIDFQDHFIALAEKAAIAADDNRLVFPAEMEIVGFEKLVGSVVPDDDLPALGLTFLIFRNMSRVPLDNSLSVESARLNLNKSSTVE
jgi:hypothetical protein